MAEAKLSPRQRMIGMMYLVLMAMLALNVQREILDAFVVLNEGNETSTKAAVDRNDILYSEFKFAYNLDPAKCGQYWNEAESIRQLTDEVVKWIDSLKIELVMANENVGTAIADTLTLPFMDGLDRYDHTTRILIGQKEDGSGGKARELKTRIETMVSEINSRLQSVGSDAVEMTFNFSDRLLEGEQVSWEMHTFYESPMAAVYAIMSKVQGDLRTMEYDAISQLFARVDVDDIPVDTVLARVLPRSNYIVMGEEYQSEIFLAAYSTTIEPQVFLGELDAQGNLIGEGRPVEVKDGMGRLSFSPQSQGWHEYEGIVRVFDKQGNKRDFPFQSEYLVAKPSAVVSALRMNAMYIGPENPMSISVPGIADDQLQVRVTGAGNQISKTAPGQYVIKLTNGSPREVEIITSSKLPSGETKEMGRTVFRVKPLPEPQVRFGTIRYNGQGTSNWASIQNLIPEYGPDFVFDLPLELTSYNIVYIKSDGQVVDKPGFSRSLTNDQKIAIQNLRPGSFFWIEDIKVKDQTGKIWDLPAIKVRIVRS